MPTSKADRVLLEAAGEQEGFRRLFVTERPTAPGGSARR